MLFRANLSFTFVHMSAYIIKYKGQRGHEGQRSQVSQVSQANSSLTAVPRSTFHLPPVVSQVSQVSQASQEEAPTQRYSRKVATSWSQSLLSQDSLKYSELARLCDIDRCSFVRELFPHRRSTFHVPRAEESFLVFLMLFRANLSFTFVHMSAYIIKYKGQRGHEGQRSQVSQVSQANSSLTAVPRSTFHLPPVVSQVSQVSQASQEEAPTQRYSRKVATSWSQSLLSQDSLKYSELARLCDIDRCNFVRGLFSSLAELCIMNCALIKGAAL